MLDSLLKCSSRKILAELSRVLSKSVTVDAKLVTLPYLLAEGKVACAGRGHCAVYAIAISRRPRLPNVGRRDPTVVPQDSLFFFSSRVGPLLLCLRSGRNSMSCVGIWGETFTRACQLTDPHSWAEHAGIVRTPTPIIRAIQKIWRSFYTECRLLHSGKTWTFTPDVMAECVTYLTMHATLLT